MDSISNAWVAQNIRNALFSLLPFNLGQKLEKSVKKKNMKTDNSKENTLIYMYMCIKTHS